MKLHHVIAASLLALASMGAQAATTLNFDSTISGISPAYTLPVTGTIVDNGAVSVTMGGLGSFEHLWKLDVDAANDKLYISFNNDTDPANGVMDITGLTVVGSTPISFSDVNGDGSLWVYQGGSLAADVYNINVSGTTSGILAGAYTVKMAPVPLPPAALLFGSALIGLAAMRRKKAAKELVEA